MLRTQISLTPEQMKRLQKAAGVRRMSVAAVIREAVDSCVADEDAGRLERQRRALTLAGAFRSGHTDTSERHDEILGDERSW